MARFGLSHSELGDKAITKAAKKIQKETGCSWNEAVFQACATLEGAGDREGATVESVQTCTDIGRRPVSGLTGDDVPEARRDKYAKSKKQRWRKAEEGRDEAAEWLRNNDPELRG